MNLASETGALLELETRNGHPEAPSSSEPSFLEKSLEMDRSRWFPWLVIALSINLLLWISMLYTVFKINDEATNRAFYMVGSWTIFGIPLLAIVVLLFSPYPNTLRTRRRKLATMRPNANYSSVISIANAACCFVLVVVYLYASAIPQYNRPKWESSIDLAGDADLPAFAFLLDNSNFVQPTDEENQLGCIILTANGKNINCSQAFAASPAVNFTNKEFKSQYVGPSSFITYIFNPNDLQYKTTSTNTTVQGFLLTIPMKLLADPFDGTDSSLLIAAFDRQIDLVEAVRCNLVQPIYIQPTSLFTCSVSVQRITDDIGIFEPPTQDCTWFYKQTLSLSGSPYKSYSLNTFNEVNYDASTCASEKDGSVNCTSTVSLIIGSKIVNTIESTHGIDGLTIWLNAGAIVGGVQFFAWFLGIFNG